MTPRDEQLYRLLLRLYPAEFRARYGRAMMDFHRDRLAARCSLAFRPSTCRRSSSPRARC
jgi:hypothetical protein